MLDRCDQTVQSLLFRCLAFLLMTTVINADGRVFVLDLRSSSGLQGFRHAEQACASRRARLASADELRHSVVECFFPSCTRGWLHGGAVGTTVCDTVGSARKAVDVRTQNATDDTAHLDAFCVKDHGVPCGDPPSFPNARLQDHTGFEMGDELLYTCVPGYVMPSGQSAFSLLCDSCGEWYGLVQICVKDGSEVHVDYEDRFTDPREEADHPEEKSEQHERMYEGEDRAAHWKGKMSHEQQETGVGGEQQRGEQEVRGEVVDLEVVTDRKVKDEERAVQDFTGHPTWQQESREVVRTDAPAATEAPVSLLSQKHMFWFPSEAFQEEGLPVSTNPATQNTQRASGAQSEESKEQESQERQQHPADGDDHDYDGDRYDDHDADDQDNHNDSHHDQDDHESRQDEDDHNHHIPAQRDGLNDGDSHERHDDHTDHYNSQEYEDQDHPDDKHKSHEDRDDAPDRRDEDDGLHASEEQPDHDDHDDDLDENDNDHDPDHRDHDDHDSYDDLDSHEYDDDGHKRVIFSIATDQSRNITQKKASVKATTDETWLDGYPVVPEETGRDDPATARLRPGHRQRGSAWRSTDRPNEVEIRRPAAFTSSPEKPESPTESEFGHAIVEAWGGFIPTAAPPSDSHAGPDNSDYDTQQAAPTDSWLGDLTEDPFLNHGPAPPVHNNDILAGVMEEHTMHNLPGEAGERGEMEGERGETACAGEDCPPRTFGRGPKVAAIIVAVLALATAVLVGVWCYRKQQQKSSVYEMNGKGQGQSRPGQQIEMQQKV